MGTMDRAEYLPTTREIHETFADEIGSLGASLGDMYDDGDRLFVRAVLPATAEVRPGDRIRAGVALRAAGPEILVHPYTLRQVCTNGAIAAHVLATRCLERTRAADVFLPAADVAVTLAELRSAIRACAARKAFDTITAEMRSALELEADVSLQLLPGLARMPARIREMMLPRIFRRFAAGEDRSAFGLLNAVTSVARDVRDPETRWLLEELGGTIPARLGPAARTRPMVSALAGV